MKIGKAKIKPKKNPFLLLKEWYVEAKKKEDVNPNAMSLSTVDSLGKPRTRMVLMKEICKEGIVFYTNSSSKKGKQLENNSNAALCFYWKSTGKQILIEGGVKKISEKDSDEYFLTRDRKSQIGSWASSQSKILKNRLTLEKNYNSFQKRFSGKVITRPKNWNGYCVSPRRFEFWLARPNRLHERIEYSLRSGKWISKNLYP